MLAGQTGIRAGHVDVGGTGFVGSTVGVSVSSQAGLQGWLKNCCGKKRTQAELSGHEV
jgi:hypothetical protein